MPFTGKISATITGTQTKASGSGTGSFPISSLVDMLWQIASGTAADESDIVYHDKITLADAASLEIDLAGTLTDIFGDTVTLARVKALIIKPVETNTGNLLVGGAAANGWSTPFDDPTDKLKIPFGNSGLILFAAGALGFPVTGGTGDLLRFEHDGTGSANLVFDLVIIGASA